MSKFNSSKVIDILGLITAIIGVVSQFIDSLSNKQEEKKGGQDEIQEKK